MLVVIFAAVNEPPLENKGGGILDDEEDPVTAAIVAIPPFGMNFSLCLPQALVAVTDAF